jgi:predicted branched-subunit amino acid permease
VSTRNLLLGMAMTHHFDGHSLRRRIAWLFLLNDPGVVNSFRQQAEVDRLGYVTGYGLSMMTSWLCSTLLGLQTASLFVALDLGAVKFAGPLVIATMMMLFFNPAGIGHGRHGNRDLAGTPLCLNSRRFSPRSR